MEIGEEIGFIQSQDMKSTSAEVADRLATIHKRYLAEFDAIHVMSFIEELQQKITGVLGLHMLGST